MASERLRVAVPPEVATMSPRSGHGRVWTHVLAGLRERVALEERSGGRRRWRRRRDVWLADGHRPLPDGIDAPLVVQVHEASWRDPELRALLDPAFAEALDANVTAAVERANIVITAAASAKRELERAYGLDPERIVIAPHGVDLEVFHPGLAPPADMRGRPYVLFVGVLHPRKGLPALREAMAALIAGGLEHALVVVGGPAGDRADPGGLAADALAELPGAPGRLVHREGGGDGELAGLMAGASALCLPSLHEGFGLPALEAMACGTPVVVSDRGSLPELVADAGLVVAPEARAVEAALRRVLTDGSLASDLAARGRARAQAFPWSRSVDGWLAALRRAASLPHA